MGRGGGRWGLHKVVCGVWYDGCVLCVGGLGSGLGAMTGGSRVEFGAFDVEEQWPRVHCSHSERSD